MTAFFYFNGSGSLGRERNLYQGGGATVNNRESGEGEGSEYYYAPPGKFHTRILAPMTCLLL